MAQVVFQQTSFSGISDSKKSGTENSVAFLRGVDHRTDPKALTLTPKSLKDSGSVVTDLVMAGVRACDNLWFYGNTGNIYKNSSGTWSLENTASDSTGNGLAYFGEDGNLYYTQDKTIGRLTEVCAGTGDFYDDFLGSEGGDPTNTKSLDTESGSSMYAKRADTASLSITGDITLEAYRKFESLPSTNNTMTLIAKWDESGTTRSYKMDVAAASNFFGDGSDGALTISTNTTEAPIDSAASGTAGTTSLTATNASFAADQKIGIYEMQGSNADTVQYTTIASYTAGTITTVDTLDISFSSAQVRVLKQYTNVTINSGKTYTAKAWDGTVGGILGFYANGTLTITGNITGSGKGFRGGAEVATSGGGKEGGWSGEGTGGASTQSANTPGLVSTANGSGAGGGTISFAGNVESRGGAGGGNATQGQEIVAVVSKGGEPAGSTNLTTKSFGGGGASGGNADLGGNPTCGAGGTGGGMLDLFAATIATITGTGDGYDLRLLVSSTGDNSEIYKWDITSLIDTSTWSRWQITWDSSASTATFYRSGVLLGTKVGALTAIHDNASEFSINADTASGGSYANFFDGLSDDDRVWNDVRTASELLNNCNRKLVGTEANQIAYYEYEDDVTDSQTSGNNDLTAVNSPTFSTDVPFSGLSTRNDQDQANTAGSFTQAYTLGTSIDEGATHRQTFVPTKDPYKSIILSIDTVGTGDWTVAVHNALNREVASSTIVNGQLATGFIEFTFSSTFRAVSGQSYHFHVTDTTGDGKVDTTGADDLETSYFTTHYQFLVDDPYHPMRQIINVLAIGNERYLATLEGGDVYDPHKLTLPSGYRIRCLSYWREYLAIGVWKTANTTPTIKDTEDGYIFFWNGTSSTYDYFITVPEGGINAMYGANDILYAMAGYNGDLVAYTGGGSAQKIKKIPGITPDTFVEFAPESMSMWRTLLRIGTDLNTDSTAIEKGVYSFGTLNRNYPHSFGFEHPLSLGTQTGTNVKTAMVFGAGQNLYIGWQNSNSFGVDKVAVSNDPYAEGSVELLIADFGKIGHKEYPLTLRADFEPLVSGQSFRIKYKADRASSWSTDSDGTVGVVEDTVGAQNVRMPLTDTRANEIQISVDGLVSTAGVATPKLTGISIESDVESQSRNI